MKKKVIISLASAAVMLLLIVSAFTASGISADNGESKYNIPVDKSWEVSFSAPMEKETFTNNAVKVKNESGELLDIEFELNKDGKKLTILPPENLYLRNHTYTLSLSEKVTSQTGESLKENTLFSFHTTKDVPVVKGADQLKQLLKNDQPQMQHAMDTADSAEGTAESEQSAYVSKTNVQVKGVDEPDIIKATADHTYTVRENDILITSNEAPNAEVIATIQEDHFWPRELFIENEKLIVIGNGLPLDEPVPKDRPHSIRYYNGALDVRIFDVSDPSTPEMVRQFQLSGNYSTSRIIEEHLYLIATAGNYFLPEESSAQEKDLRPMIKDSATSSDKPLPVDFDSIHYFDKDGENVFTMLASIDLGQLDQEAGVETYLGAAHSIYVSKKHLYTTKTEYTWKDDNQQYSPPDEISTNIKQFKLDQGTITFENEQRVPGHVLNQFSMDERNESFRIATTSMDNPGDGSTSVNHLFTYDLSLNRLGSVENLAKGERIYSARFMDKRAYLVTFEQVDPLFVIDLTNPQNPKVLGKLKIPGFSNYLHPIGENLVLGFGKQTELVEMEGQEEPLPRTTGVKISLFNIEDLNNPVEQDSVVLGDHGFSELNYNHKALYWHPDKNLFGLPVHTYKENFKEGFNGAYLYEVSPEKGLEEFARITLYPEEKNDKQRWQYQLKRMISVNEDLYAFSNMNMKVLNLESKEIIQKLVFPPMENFR